MSTSNNVVKLPVANTKLKNAAKSIEDVQNDIDQARKMQCELIVEDILSYMYNMFDCYNIEVTDEFDMKNVAMVVESLRSLTHGVYSITHPLQSISQSIFKVTSKDGDPIIEINDIKPDETKLN